MQRTMIETLMGVVVLAVAGLFLAFAYSSSDLRVGSGYEVTASFGKIGGVKVGSPVKVSGIAIGSVTGLALDEQNFQAVVTMMLDDGRVFPDDTAAEVASEGLLGGNYIELIPGGSPDMIEAGGVIEYTQGAVDIVDLLGKFIFSAEGAGSGGASN